MLLYRPNSVIELCLGCYFILPLNNLPKSLEILKLSRKYSKVIVNINQNCQIIKQ